jgi:UDP-glucose 4-epimerase
VKKILIVGKNSFVGKNLCEWLNKHDKQYSVETISLRNHRWKEMCFSKYDVVVYTVGLAHKRENKTNIPLYYKLNRDLTLELAMKSKEEGVKQFIYFSSMSVYGMYSGIVSKSTPTMPQTHYGRSKLQAETLLNNLSTETFDIAIIRPPMIYGKGCKGNYKLISFISRKTPIFPIESNKRSMIYIDNLSEFTKNLIDSNEKGYFHPQNSRYVCTTEMVKEISKVHYKNILFLNVKIIIKFFMRRSRLMNKVFGDLYYDESLSTSKIDYNVVGFEKSIILTERE